MAKVLKYHKDNIKTNEELYHADEDTLLRIVRSLKDKYSSVILVGHNPVLPSL